LKPLDRHLEAAVEQANRSPCAKSKRGVVVWEPFKGVIMGRGHNAPPSGLTCDGSEACRQSCGKVCVHAEMNAIFSAYNQVIKSDMLHIKTVGGEPVPSGPPSCWQCSRNIVAAGIAYVWLLHEKGWRRYPASEFHQLTLQHCGLPGVRR
jgi:deoxycytidylate deaminase